MSECHVLCVMLERVLRTCPDGSVPLSLYKLLVAEDSKSTSTVHMLVCVCQRKSIKDDSVHSKIFFAPVWL